MQAGGTVHKAVPKGRYSLNNDDIRSPTILLLKLCYQTKARYKESNKSQEAYGALEIIRHETNQF
jgi:hypothetical protein